MATDTANEKVAETLEEPSVQESPEAPPGRGISKIKIAALLVGLIVVMMGIGVIFMPESSDNPDASGNPANITDSTEQSIEDTVEVEIGSFNCTNSRSPEVNVHIKFTLIAEVQSNNVQYFKKARDKFDARISDAVNQILRSASLEDLSDPELGTIKRLLREEINKKISKTYVIRVLFPDWQTTER